MSYWLTRVLTWTLGLAVEGEGSSTPSSLPSNTTSTQVVIADVTSTSDHRATRHRPQLQLRGSFSGDTTATAEAGSSSAGAQHPPKQQQQPRYLHSAGAQHPPKQQQQPRYLHSACAQNNLALLHELLQDPSLDINKPNKHRRTALMGAAFFGHEEVVRLLLSRGADVNARCCEGATPLIYATMGGRRAVVELLLANGAKRDVVTGTSGSGTSSGPRLTARAIALQAGDKALAKLIEGRDVLSELPLEIALLVLQQLDVQALVAASAVSKRWYVMANDPQVWRPLSVRHGLTSFLGGVPLSLLAPTPSPAQQQAQKRQQYKMFFVERRLIERNWVHGHNENVLVHTGTREPHIAATLDQNTLVLISMATGKLKTVEVTARTIRVMSAARNETLRPCLCCAFVAAAGGEQGYVVSGHKDGEIIVRRVANGDIVQVVQDAHQSNVSVLYVDAEHATVVSASFDGLVRLWHYDKGQGKFVLRPGRSVQAHHVDIYAVKLVGDTLVTAGGDQIVKVWRNLELVMELRGHNKAITSIDMDENYIYSGGLDLRLIIWRRDNGDQQYNSAMRGRVRSVRLIKGLLVVACIDIPRAISIIENPGQTTQRAVTLQQNNVEGRIGDVLVTERCIVAPTQDGKAYIWDFFPKEDVASFDYSVKRSRTLLFNHFL